MMRDGGVVVVVARRYRRASFFAWAAGHAGAHEMDVVNCTIGSEKSTSDWTRLGECGPVLYGDRLENDFVREEGRRGGGGLTAWPRCSE